MYTSCCLFFTAHDIAVSSVSLHNKATRCRLSLEKRGFLVSEDAVSSHFSQYNVTRVTFFGVR